MPDVAHRLSLISALDPGLLGLVDLALSGQEAMVMTATLHPDLAERGVVRLSCQQALGQDPEILDVPMPGHCQTCSLREVLIAVAQDRAEQEPEGATVVLLPPAIELVHLLPRLAAELADLAPGVRLAAVAHVLDAAVAHDELLEHRLLADAGLASYPGDERCTGEIHMVNLGYADVVLSLGHDTAGVGADLIEHLRPHETLLLPGLSAPILECLLSIDHDAPEAIRRVHPATTQAWGGPGDHGVWTLDLSASLPFHPGRLRELVADLAGSGLCARGCFWLPSRPGRVCAWEVAGGAVSVGDAGAWKEVPAAGQAQSEPLVEPRCHLVVTGVGEPQVRDQVRAAFEQVLLRPEEMPGALAWIGVDDGLGDWFGQAEQ
ncbi:GTP-binding protein [Actinomyces slackii]|uniref:Cobalamin synthesis protein cobW C-terminal domain n=1 Tax=Actinomyces slackii TaxID=52774 RepID=A0A3S4WJY4_9ACTO|nr:Cobalamin synthesis protein cobW C-terminal domain [Actinomyces slackii]